MKMRFSMKQFGKSDNGMAAIEAGMVFPFILFLLFGLVDVTNMVSYNRQVTAISSATADLVGQSRNQVVRTSINDYFNIVKMIMGQNFDSKVSVRIYGFRRPATGTTISKIWSVKNGKGPGCSAEPTPSSMLSLMQPGTDLVVAQTCYIHTPILGKLLISDPMKYQLRGPFAMEQVITQTPRSSKTLNCVEANEVTPCPVNLDSGTPG
jgi:hypothetical protein